jgi:hypothetical protein
MIDYKTTFLGLNISKTTVIIEDTELNAGTQSIPYDFTGRPILFITIKNDAGTQFTNLDLQDSLSRVLTHNVPLFATTYSIAFSGKASGQPLTQAELTSLDAVTINWVLSGLAVGTLTINIYTFEI